MMKKQLQKFKLGVENLSRPSKPDKNSEELLAADTQVERYKDVLEKIVKKFGPVSGGSSVGGVSLPGSGSGNGGGGSSGANGDGPMDAASREKRCKKLHEFRLALAMEESSAAMPDGLLREVLSNCARLERSIAYEIVDNETKVEASVTRKLTDIMDKHLTTIQKQKRIVTKLMQDKETAKYKHQAAVRVQESAAKIAQLREEQEECETKLEKERDIWAAEMFELIAEEENMANYIVNYVTAQRLYYKSALEQIEDVMQRVDGLIRGSNKRIFKVPLDEHLSATDRKIAHVIEMCVCCLLERGLNEEGLLRVGCAGSKLRRFRTAIDANIAQPPLPAEYGDVHVIAGVLKLYLRDLPDPLLTYRLYDEFVAATRRPTEEQCKRAILNAVNQLPADNYLNLRYLTRFLSILADNSAQNKMSSQNIAIVMSPNLLWSPASDADTAAALDSASDYLQKVNSSTAVNRIVELLVADWSFFFDGEIDFYQTLRRDELFRETGSNGSNGHAALPSFVAGGAVHGHAHTTADISEPMLSHAMTKSMNAAFLSNESSAVSMAATTAAMNTSTTGHGGYVGSHSRSNSHDTSLILLSGHLDGTKRSQSSSSLSDASSPPGLHSPKLPVRRKHNKPAAPTPPDTRYAHGDAGYRHDHYDEQPPHTNASTSQSKPMAAIRHVFESTDSLSSSHSTLAAHPNGASAGGQTARPDKPPRPAFTATDCQTLNRSQYRSAKESTSSSHARPSALPKGMLFANRSTENLSDKGGCDGNTSPVLLRDKPAGDAMLPPTTQGNAVNVPTAGKPAIPERPMSLMRPNSFKNAIGGGVGINATTDNISHSSGGGGHPFGGSDLKKTHSFRGIGVSSAGTKPQNGQTTLERTHIYNVDKKQVAIIDFVDSSRAATTGTDTKTTFTTAAPQLQSEAHRNGNHNASIVTATLKITPSSIAVALPTDTSSTTSSAPTATSAAGAVVSDTCAAVGSQQHTHHVPPSPRGFDPKIKRPQIPAPPPPVAAGSTAAALRPKSESGDSTHL